MENQDLSGKEAIKKMKEIVNDVNDVNVAMMCTTEKNGSIHSRPMSTAGFDDDGTIWFFTNDHAAKVDEIENENELCLCYSKPTDNTYACIMGSAKAVKDKAKARALWNPLLKAWFPEGTDDPAMELIKVTPNHAEYWNENDSRMVVFFKIAKAAVTGKKYPGNGAHGKAKL